MNDLIRRKDVLALAKDLCIPGKDGVYKHRSIDHMEYEPYWVKAIIVSVD